LAKAGAAILFKPMGDQACGVFGRGFDPWIGVGSYQRYSKVGRQAVEKDIEWVYEVFPRLKERHTQMAGTMSGGEQQMLAIGRGMMARPQLTNPPLG